MNEKTLKVFKNLLRHDTTTYGFNMIDEPEIYLSNNKATIILKNFCFTIKDCNSFIENEVSIKNPYAFMSFMVINQNNFKNISVEDKVLTVTLNDDNEVKFEVEVASSEDAIDSVYANSDSDICHDGSFDNYIQFSPEQFNKLESKYKFTEAAGYCNENLGDCMFFCCNEGNFYIYFSPAVIEEDIDATINSVLMGTYAHDRKIMQFPKKIFNIFKGEEKVSVDICHDTIASNDITCYIIHNYQFTKGPFFARISADYSDIFANHLVCSINFSDKTKAFLKTLADNWSDENSDTAIVYLSNNCVNVSGMSFKVGDDEIKLHEGEEFVGLQLNYVTMFNEELGKYNIYQFSTNNIVAVNENTRNKYFALSYNNK